MLSTTGTCQVAQRGANQSSTESMPGFWSPMAWSSPAGASAIRGGGEPLRGERVVPRVTIAPKRSMSICSAASNP
jgi:hypothetical protein